MPNYNPGGSVGTSFTQAAKSQARNSVSPQSSVSNLLGSAAKFGQGLVGQVGNAIKGVAEDVFTASNFMSLLRGGGLPKFGMPGSVGFSDVNWVGTDNDDWRVRLSMPLGLGLEPNLLEALEETSGMIFPYTPSIIMSHSANYSQVKPTHSNYPFPVYQNSQPDNIQITGPFIIESEAEGLYWVAMIHYLRSITKMSYGNSSNQGAPPPVVQLNGYGSFVFKNVPVVVQQFTCELPEDVDYIYISALDTWAPTRCNVSVVLMPTYSRRSVQQFSLDKFVSGGYAKGSGQGFI
jgi:hypothetical protein|tara:strand:- start:8251 stop:9126 length:876 start_codon:yes stop_codon:yes gene_type:complete